MPVSPSISKGRYLAGRQCSKLFWHLVNDPTSLPPADAGQQAAFDQGRDVGRQAQRLFPGGLEIVAAAGDLDAAVRLTAQCLAQRKPVFEGAFAAAGGIVRADILVPVGKTRWDLFEVKSSTSVSHIAVQLMLASQRP